jgi:hypothetical protein
MEFTTSSIIRGGLNMTHQELSEHKFRKLLVSHYSPQNKCFVSDGEILYPPPAGKGLSARHGASHEFLSAIDHKTRCKFGWVKLEKTDFSVGEFLQTYSLDTSSEQIEVLFQMFTAISALQEGTPVAGSYFSRGVEYRQTLLNFHKVFLSRLKMNG